MKAGSHFQHRFRLNLSESQANHRKTQLGQTLTSAINYSLTLHQRAACLMRSNTNCNTFCLPNVGIHGGDGVYGSLLSVSIINGTICMSTSDCSSPLIHMKGGKHFHATVTEDDKFKKYFGRILLSMDSKFLLKYTSDYVHRQHITQVNFLVFKGLTCIR